MLILLYENNEYKLYWSTLCNWFVFENKNTGNVYEMGVFRPGNADLEEEEFEVIKKFISKMVEAIYCD